MDQSPSALHYPDVVSRSASSSKFFLCSILSLKYFFLLKDSKQAASNYAAGLRMAR
jgi:hypothetical protein